MPAKVWIFECACKLIFITRRVEVWQLRKNQREGYTERSLPHVRRVCGRIAKFRLENDSERVKHVIKVIVALSGGSKALRRRLEALKAREVDSCKLVAFVSGTDGLRRRCKLRRLLPPAADRCSAAA